MAASQTPARLSQARRWQPRALLLGLSVCLQLLTLGDRWGAPDETARVRSAQALLDHGTLRLPGGGHTKYPPLTSVLLAPGVWLQRHTPGNSDAFLMLPPLVASAAMVLPFHHALTVMQIWPPAALAAAALFAVVNPTWPYGKRLYSEPFTALFVLAAFAAALAWRQQRKRASLLVCWLCMWGAVGNNSVVLVLGPVLAAMTSVQSFRPRRLDRTAAVWAAAAGGGLVLAWLALNQVRFGSPWTTGYADTTVANDVFDGQNGFSTPLLVGLWGLLLSGGRGLIIYCPLALVGAWALDHHRARWRGAAVYLLLGGVLPLLVYSKWWSWHGGTCYGPRLMTPFVPLWLLGVGPLLEAVRTWRVRLVTRAAAAVSAAAALAGTLFTFSYDQQFWMRGKPFNDYLDVYAPQYSQVATFARNAWLFPEDVTWLWLQAGTRPPLRLQMPPDTFAVEVRLARQATRDRWQVREVAGLDATHARVTATAAHAEPVGNVNALADGNPKTVWDAGTQRAGQYLRVEFAAPVASVEMLQGNGQAGFARFGQWRARSGSGVWSPYAQMTTPRPPVGLRWPGWVFGAGALVCAWRLRRLVRHGRPIWRAVVP